MRFVMDANPRHANAADGELGCGGGGVAWCGGACRIPLATEIYLLLADETEPRTDGGASADMDDGCRGRCTGARWDPVLEWDGWRDKRVVWWCCRRQSDSGGRGEQSDSGRRGEQLDSGRRREQSDSGRRGEQPDTGHGGQEGREHTYVGTECIRCCVAPTLFAHTPAPPVDGGAPGTPEGTLSAAVEQGQRRRRGCSTTQQT